MRTDPGYDSQRLSHTHYHSIDRPLLLSACSFARSYSLLLLRNTVNIFYKIIYKYIEKQTYFISAIEEREIVDGDYETVKELLRSSKVSLGEELKGYVVNLEGTKRQYLNHPIIFNGLVRINLEEIITDLSIKTITYWKILMQ